MNFVLAVRIGKEIKALREDTEQLLEINKEKKRRVFGRAKYVTEFPLLQGKK